MKNMKLMYNNFVPTRPEHTTLLELWCLIGGTIIFVFIVSNSENIFYGTPEIEIIMSLILPALYFYINYLARYIDWMKIVLLLIMTLALLMSIYLLISPSVQYQHAPSSFSALIVFFIVSFLIVITKKMRV